MELTEAEIDALAARWMCGDDTAYEPLAASGPQSLRRLLATLLGEEGPTRARLVGVPRTRESAERLSDLRGRLAAAFPDALFEEIARDRRLESAVLWLLQGVADPRGVAVAERGLRSPRAIVRWEALHALARLGCGDHTEAVVALLDDERLRVAAYETLALIGDARAVGPLLARLSSSDEWTARWAARTLERIECRLGGPSAPPVWRELPQVNVTLEAEHAGMRVIEVLVEPGCAVADGAVLAVVENEAFGHDLVAPVVGTVVAVLVTAGDRAVPGRTAFRLQARRRIG
ncbi:HEAT repeat domain-containing protein [Kitasatospora sp. NPDC054939]